MGCSSRKQEEEYRGVVDSFVEWCGLNHKTKELVVDFRKQTTHPTPVTIRENDVEVVEGYKYMGVYTDSQLD